MNRSLLGGIEILGATTLQSEMSSGACSRSKPRVLHLPWGDPRSGGDSSAVKDQLRSVQRIQATHRAFAAILADGSVITWGHPDFGGDSSSVQDHLNDF